MIQTLGGAILARISSREEFDIARELIENNEEVVQILPNKQAVYLGITDTPVALNGLRVPQKFSFEDNFSDKSYIHTDRGKEPWVKGEPSSGENAE